MQLNGCEMLEYDYKYISKERKSYLDFFHEILISSRHIGLNGNLIAVANLTYIAKIEP